MSIYATLWRLQFPRYGDAYAGCQWVDVMAQGVPAHVGTPTPGYGYESGDPYAAFLPRALRIDNGTPEDELRAVVFVRSTTKKGTSRRARNMSRRYWCSLGRNTRRCRFRFFTTACAKPWAGTGQV